MEKANFRKINHGMYIVRTQAGFKQAMNDFEDGMESRGYPEAYPAFVSLSMGYNGSTFIQVNSMHINSLMRELAGE